MHNDIDAFNGLIESSRLSTLVRSSMSARYERIYRSYIGDLDKLEFLAVRSEGLVKMASGLPDVAHGFRAEWTWRLSFPRVAATFEKTGPLPVQVEWSDLHDRLREQFRRYILHLLPVTLDRFRREVFIRVLAEELVQ